MARWNFEGVPRRELKEALRRREIVNQYVRRNACMLCMREGVMACGLCEYCYAMLDGEELNAAVDWNTGFRP
ncbi:MAG: hypothetical protein JNJ45_04555 [Chthonomonas sp.]|nr:hypothetical protein [Chthonomonas sp.]